MDKIEWKHLPFFIIMYFGLVSPYYVAWYLFDKQDFFMVDNFTKILLCIGYTFPILYLTVLNMVLINYMIPESKTFFDQEFHVIFTFFCYCSALYLYAILFIYYCFYDHVSFICYRNNSWLWSFILLVAGGALTLVVGLIKRSDKNPKK